MATIKAFIAALDEYPNPANNLPSCINDARAFEAMLRRTYRVSEIRSAYNEQATVANVENGINWLTDDPDPDLRRILFFSGHGWRTTRDGEVKEVLCCYDDFLFDTNLVARSQTAPPGTLTCVIDSCHAGGMHKFIVFDSTVEYGMTKVMPFPPMAELERTEKAFLDPALAGRLQYKAFGASAGDALALAKRFDPGAQKAFADQPGTLALNGLLIAACLADETATASTPQTAGLSAFTFAMLAAFETLGPEASNATLLAAVETRLREHGFRQTPVREEGRLPGDLARRPFLLVDTLPTAPPTRPVVDSELCEKIAELLSLPAVDSELCEKIAQLLNLMPTNIRNGE